MRFDFYKKEVYKKYVESLNLKWKGPNEEIWEEFEKGTYFINRNQEGGLL